MEKIDEKILKNRWMILSVLVMMPFMATLDSSIINVALPVMAKNLSVEMASIEWVVTSYLIVISATILIFGRLGDIKGKTRVFIFGIVVFTIGSFLCGIANTLPMLVFSRVIQAVGAAGAMSTSQGIITQVFPANERGRALGISGTFVALGTMVGPPLGGFMVSILSWHYIFLINIPIGLGTCILAMKIMPKSKAMVEEKLDLKGAVLFSLFVVLLFYSIISGHEMGYGNPLIISGFILSIAFIIIFIIIERKMEEPLLKLDIFKNKLFSISIFCAFISFVGISSTNLIQPFYLQDVLKMSPRSTGLFMMIYPMVLSLVSPISGHLSDKIGSELLTFMGLMFTALGLFLLSTLNEELRVLPMILFVVLLSIGNGLFQSPNNSLVMSTVPRNKLGIAGSVNALVRNLGLVFGVSFSTSLLYNRMSYGIGYKVSGYVEGREDVFIYAMRIVYISAACICLLGAIITAMRLVKKKRSFNA